MIAKLHSGAANCQTFAYTYLPSTELRHVICKIVAMSRIYLLFKLNLLVYLFANLFGEIRKTLYQMLVR